MPAVQFTRSLVSPTLSSPHRPQPVHTTSSGFPQYFLSSNLQTQLRQVGNARQSVLMQRQKKKKKTLDSLPNTVDYEQDSSSDNMDIDQSAPWHGLSMHSSSHLNLMSHAGANQDTRLFSGKGSVEPCSSSNSKNIVDDDDGLKMEQGWPYTFRAAPGCSSRSGDVDFERSRPGFPSTSTVGPNVCSTSNSSHFSFMPHERSTSMGHRAYQIPGCMESNHKHWQALRENVFSNLLDEYRETQTGQMFPADCGHFGSSPGSSSYSMGEMDGSRSSIASWGQSSKRKLREDACSQSHPNGNTGRFTQNPNNAIYGGPCNNTFNAIDGPLFPWPCTDSSAAQLNQGNASQSDAHHPLQRAEDAESSLRNLDRLGSLRNPQDFLPFDSSLDDNARQPNVHMFEPASQPQHYTGLPVFRSDAVVDAFNVSAD